jgi:hypothetical protein
MTDQYFTINRWDIGMFHVTFKGQRITIADFMPPITPTDVGKRISRRRGILEVETMAERDERYARDRQAFADEASGGTDETAPTDEAREDRWASENEAIDDGYGEDHGGY